MNGLGDRKPSELLQHIRSQNSDPKTVFRALFLNQLPAEVKRVLAHSPELELEASADRVMESDLISPVIASVKNDNSDIERNSVRLNSCLCYLCSF